jgi:hypothetical protein
MELTQGMLIKAPLERESGKNPSLTDRNWVGVHFKPSPAAYQDKGKFNIVFRRKMQIALIYSRFDEPFGVPPSAMAAILLSFVGRLVQSILVLRFLPLDTFPKTPSNG